MTIHILAAIILGGGGVWCFVKLWRSRRRDRLSEKYDLSAAKQDAQPEGSSQ